MLALSQEEEAHKEAEKWERDEKERKVHSLAAHNLLLVSHSSIFMNNNPLVRRALETQLL